MTKLSAEELARLLAPLNRGCEQQVLDHIAALEAELANAKSLLQSVLASRDAAIADFDRVKAQRDEARKALEFARATNQSLVASVSGYARELAACKAERDRYREALEWYASIDYVTHEWGRCSVGDKARQALEGGEK